MISRVIDSFKALRWQFPTIVLLIGVWQACAQHGDAGTAAFPFLNMGVDARALAMGNVGAGMPNELYGGLSNPASLGYSERMQAMLAYRPVMLDVRAGALAFSRPLHNKGVVAAHLLYMSYGRIDGVDEQNQSTGQTWSPYSLAGSVSWARIVFAPMSLGITIKGIYDRLGEGYSADGFAVDLGMQYRALSERLIYGVLLRNLGFLRSGYSDETDDLPLPFSAVAGISYVPRQLHSMRMALDLVKAVDDYLNYCAGLEIALYKRYLFARGGYRFSHRDLEEVFQIIRNKSDNTYQKTNWSSATFGIGVAALVGLTEVKLDAALSLYTEGLPPTYALSAIVGF